MLRVGRIILPLGVVLLIGCVAGQATPAHTDVPVFNTPSLEPPGPEVPAGLYRTRSDFPLPFTFRTTDTYRGVWEDFGDAKFVGIGQGSAIGVTRMLTWWALEPGYSAEQALAGLQVPGATDLDLTAPRPTAIFGLPATQIDGTGDGFVAFGAFSDFVGHTGEAWHTPPDPHVRFILLDVGDRTLMVYIEAQASRWDAFLTGAQGVLNSVTFAEPE